MTVAKVVELIGSSPKSWEDATKNAITEAAKTVRGIKSVYLKRTQKVFIANKRFGIWYICGVLNG